MTPFPVALRGASARRREVPLEQAGEQAGPDRTDLQTYTAELRRVPLEAIDHLPPTFREVVRLRDLEQRSNAEVSEQLHISKRNVSVRLNRTHRLLRASLTKR